MIRSQRLRLICATLLAAAAASLGWLVPVGLLSTPAPRAVIPVGDRHGLRFNARGTAFAPSGPLFATVKYKSVGVSGFGGLGVLGISGVGRLTFASPNLSGEALAAVQLWDSGTGTLRAELCKLKSEEFGCVEFSSDGTRVRVIVTDRSSLGSNLESSREIAKEYRRYWDVATASERDPDAPFEPFSFVVAASTRELEHELRTAQLAYSPTDCALRGDAMVFVNRTNELRLGFARERSSRKIADAPAGRFTAFAISPDAGQLVLNVPPHNATGRALLDRVRSWLDPRLEDADPNADEDGTSDTVNYVTDVESGRVVACWKTPHVASYKFFPDGRTLAVVSDEQTAFYDTPFHEPRLQRLAIGLGAATVTFLLAWLVFTPGSFTFWFRKVVRIPRVFRRSPA